MESQIEETTSSNPLDGNETQQPQPQQQQQQRASAAPPPKRAEVRDVVSKLATSLTESYQLVKQRQQRYSQLSAAAEWHDVCAASKNKLKRKKKLSASLTSVSDSVNQEKRTRIEGMQLNCRGKLAAAATKHAAAAAAADTGSEASLATTTRLAAKPPLPPASGKREEARSASGSPSQPSAAAAPAKVPPPPPPPRLKRKLQENMQTIQKLNTLTEQLRLEINELKCSLSTERGAVRVLRAQNECESRRWKSEVKRLQQSVESLKKSAPTAGGKRLAEAEKSSPGSASSAGSSAAHHEIQRLTNEILVLKEASRASGERKLMNCDADRRKAADVRELRDAYEIRLTQLTKSAKNEISRLLEEIKTKERNIGQLKRELQQQQSAAAEAARSKNAATNTTTTKTTTKKSKKSSSQLQSKQTELKSEETLNVSKTHETSNENAAENAQHNVEDTSGGGGVARDPREMKQLKDFEAINNTRNFTLNNTNTEHTNNVIHRTTKTFIVTQNASAKLLAGDGRESDAKENNNNNNNTLSDTTVSLSQDNNSDSDSALSSAPPSLSPQPPPNGVDATDIWQSLRNYSADIEKLQKDLDLLQKENAELRQELHAAQQQIVESEKSAAEAASNGRLQQLMERIRYLEQREHQLQAESDELREQNELLEFRILELEDSSDKWSLQNPSTPACPSGTSTSMATAKDVWCCGETSNHTDHEAAAQLMNGSGSSLTRQHLEERTHTVSPFEMNLDDHLTTDELRRLLVSMLQRLPLNADEMQCVQQMLSLLQNVDAISHRSGPDSLTTSASEEASSLDMVKSRISDYSSASSSTSSSTSSARCPVLTASADPKSKSAVSTASPAPQPRIVATVLPYNSSAACQQHAPTNTPADSPRKLRTAWQSSSLSESGVFVESDFLSDSSENHACTQTDFEEVSRAATAATATGAPAKELPNELQKLQPACVTTAFLSSSPRTLSAPVTCDPKRLQYYKERLELLENKVLIYESSGELQVKRLAARLQREIELEKQVKELRDRVDFLEEENATLEEEKCEFEEAENDTRLRLQRLEVEQEILSQRNVELEMSREALSAKYKDCRAECLILRDDLSVSETQIRHLEEDKQRAKENLEFLHNTLPLFVAYGAYVASAEQQQEQRQQQTPLVCGETSPATLDNTPQQAMGNAMFPMPPPPGGHEMPRDACARFNRSHDSLCTPREVDYLKEEVKILRNQIKDLNSRHYEAMESADSHWVDLEKEYKEREEGFRAKESCLKQKIKRLQDCLRDDARAANEKILQLEDQEKSIKACLLRISKEQRDLSQEHQNLLTESHNLKEQNERLKVQQQPLRDALDVEKKRNKGLTDELNFMRRLQSETESRNLQEMETLRNQLFEVKKEFLHVEVTNSELREEVTTLEQQLEALHTNEKEYVDRIRCLTDEVRSKEEMCVKLEKQLQRSEGHSLAQELDGSPSKRFKREDVRDLQSASKGLGSALRSMKDCSLIIPSHQKFTSVARDVKKLADSLLGVNTLTEDVEELMKHIENQINEQLMNFHSRKMESEFYCTVYYPVKRQVPLEVRESKFK